MIIWPWTATKTIDSYGYWIKLYWCHGTLTGYWDFVFLEVKYFGSTWQAAMVKLRPQSPGSDKLILFMIFSANLYLYVTFLERNILVIISIKWIYLFSVSSFCFIWKFRTLVLSGWWPWKSCAYHTWKKFILTFFYHCYWYVLHLLPPLS